MGSAKALHMLIQGPGSITSVAYWMHFALWTRKQAAALLIGRSHPAVLDIDTRQAEQPWVPGGGLRRQLSVIQSGNAVTAQQSDRFES